MSTSPKMVHPHGPTSDEQLDHDRIVGLVTFVVVAALITLLIWLASMGNVPAPSIDYWPPM